MDRSSISHAQWMVARTENPSDSQSLPVPFPPRPNLWLCFRGKWKRSNPEADASVRISADSKYWMWINGVSAVIEGQLKRGPTPSDTYCDLFDAASFLAAGDNLVAILVWYFGRDGFCHHSSGKPGLFVESADGALLSGDHWKACRHPAFGDTGAPHPNSRLPESNIHFDARNDLPGWETPGYDDESWMPAVSCGSPPCSPWGNLVPRPTPFWRDSGLMEFLQCRSELVADGGMIHRAVLPRNLAVTPWVELSSPSGRLIDFRTDNYTGGSEPNLRAEYVTREGVQQWEVPAYFNGHEVHVSTPSGVELRSLQYRATGYDTEFLGKFLCDDPFLNLLWEKSLNTMDINMRDAIQDPDRERSQWWGDETIILNQIFYSCDNRGHAIIRKGLLELAAWQRPDGVIYSPVPGCWRQELPQQSLASIGRYGLWQYCLHTGDRETTAKIFPAIERYLKIWEWSESGLVEYRAGGWDWADWGENIDSLALLQCWMALALEGAANVAEWIGETACWEEWTQRRQSLVEAFDRTFWRGNGFASPGWSGPFDDRVQGLALAADMVEASRKPAVFRLLEEMFHAGPYLEFFVLDGLFRNGRHDQALERMKRRYTDMVESPLSTLWEGWTIGSKEFGGGTYNHGWAGGPLVLLSRYVAGIEVFETGGKTIRIQPNLCGLSRVEAVFPTRWGPLELEVTKENDFAILNIDVPMSLSVEVKMPSGQAGISGTEEIRTLQAGKTRLAFPLGSRVSGNSK